MLWAPVRPTNSAKWRLGSGKRGSVCFNYWAVCKKCFVLGDTMLNRIHVESARWSSAKLLQLLRSHACRGDPTGRVSLVSTS